MSIKSKFGRNPLPENKKRSININFYVNDEELKIIKSKFSNDNTGGKIRQYLLNTDSSLTHINDDLQEAVDKNVVFQLRKLAVNLNQITYKINIGEYPASNEIEILLTHLTQLVSEKLSS